MQFTACCVRSDRYYAMGRTSFTLQVSCPRRTACLPSESTWERMLPRHMEMSKAEAQHTPKVMASTSMPVLTYCSSVGLTICRLSMVRLVASNALRAKISLHGARAAAIRRSVTTDK